MPEMSLGTWRLADPKEAEAAGLSAGWYIVRSYPIGWGRGAEWTGPVRRSVLDRPAPLAVGSSVWNVLRGSCQTDEQFARWVMSDMVDAIKDAAEREKDRILSHLIESA